MTLRELINSVYSEKYSNHSATRSTSGRLLPKGRKKGDKKNSLHTKACKLFFTLLEC